MPMYEYHCVNCGKRFEQIQKFSDAPLTVHPECGSGPVERLISVPTFQFKGSGWYVTDYAKGGTSNGASKADSKPSDEKPSETKKDSAKTENSGTSSTTTPSGASSSKES